VSAAITSRKCLLTIVDYRKVIQVSVHCHSLTDNSFPLACATALSSLGCAPLWRSFESFLD
jgi:hypothetical protein